MTLPTTTALTVAQELRLDKLGKEDPEPQVVAWAEDGPVVRRGNGKLSRLRPTGRLTFMRWEEK